MGTTQAGFGLECLPMVVRPLGVDMRSHLLAARWSERSHALSYLLYIEFAVGILKQTAKIEGTSLVRKRIFNIPALRSQTTKRFDHQLVDLFDLFRCSLSTGLGEALP